MKKISFFSFLLFVLCACNNNEEPSNDSPVVQDDINVATDFIRAALDGNYDKAKKLAVPDSLNKQTLDFFENNYIHRMSPEDKRGYRESSIRILQSQTLNDSVTIVTYSNSFKNKPDSLKVVRLNGKWLIDMGYRFHHPDSTIKK